MTRNALRKAAAVMSTGALLMTAPMAFARHGADDPAGDDRGADTARAEVRVNGSCTGSTDVKLKLKNDDGGIESELEVDSNRIGQNWRAVMTQNGAVVARTTGVTRGRSGSFEVRRLLRNRAGTDVVRGVATNLRSGEVCRVAARL